MEKITVIDGCTLEIGSHPIRLAGVKAPEWGAWLFEESKKHLEELIADKDIKLLAVGVAYDEAVVEAWANEKSVNEAMNKFLKKRKYIHTKKPGSLRLRRSR